MLCDTGPLVSLIVQRDPFHAVCTKAARADAGPPLVTTWLCVTEAMHLLRREGGWKAQNQLWRMIESGIVALVPQIEADHVRMASLMQTCRDSPMDVADASLVLAAEVTNDHRIFTLDQHFRAYLIHDRIPFEVVP